MDHSEESDQSNDKSTDRSNDKSIARQRVIDAINPTISEELALFSARRRQLVADILYDNIMGWLTEFIRNAESDEMDIESISFCSSGSTATVKSKPRANDTKKVENDIKPHCSCKKTEWKAQLSQPKFNSKHSIKSKPSVKTTKKPNAKPRSE